MWDFFLPKIISSDINKREIWDRVISVNDKLSKSNKLIIVNYSAGIILPIRSWPLDNFVILIKHILSNNSNHYVILIGTNDTKKDADYICNNVENEKCINLSGKLELKQLIVNVP